MLDYASRGPENGGNGTGVTNREAKIEGADGGLVMRSHLWDSALLSVCVSITSGRLKEVVCKPNELPPQTGAQG